MPSSRVIGCWCGWPCSDRSVGRVELRKADCDLSVGLVSIECSLSLVRHVRSPSHRRRRPASGWWRCGCGGYLSWNGTSRTRRAAARRGWLPRVDLSGSVLPSRGCSSVEEHPPAWWEALVRSPASAPWLCCQGTRCARLGTPTITYRDTAADQNNRLAAIGYSWIFTAAARPSPTRQHYLARREDGDGRPGALRHLFNKLLGQLHHCLAAGHTYDPTKTWPPTKTGNASNADQAAA